MTNQACIRGKGMLCGPGDVCLCVTGSIYRLVFVKKYDRLTENSC